MSTDLRQALIERASTASSPFIDSDPAFMDLPAPGRVDWTFAALSALFVPSLSDVAQTGEFQMWGSEQLVHVPTGSVRNTSVLEPQLGQLVPMGAPGQPIGYFGIRQRIESYHAHKQDEAFAQTLKGLVTECRRKRDLHAEPAQRLDWWVLRIGRISSAVAEALADSVQVGALSCVIGIDPTRPELSQSVLFDAVSEGPPADHIVRTDVQVTRLLQPGERTGLFRRTTAAPPAVHAGSEVASCYVRLKDDFTPAMCVDVLAARGELGIRLEQALADLNARTLIEPAGKLVKDLLDGPFVVPTFLEATGIDLKDARDRCDAVAFYKESRLKAKA